MPGAGATYPADREAEVVLRDGSTVHVRPVRAKASMSRMQAL